MTQQEIIESNKLIAEFMGYEGQHEEWCGNNIMDVSDFVTGEKSLRPFNPHERWDDLMPVVGKVREVWMSSKYNDEYDKIKQRWTPIANALLTANTENIWHYVVQFIKWHSTTLNPSL